ncbi:MAG: DUF488 domain-containing protein [Alphaproteobacteria bacterium]|nr:DUF488 domain-containing protein [Alphaproteobacteria bacterium]
MILRTDYFAKLKKRGHVDSSPISVARYSNKIKIPTCPDLFPPKELLKGCKSGSIFEKEYLIIFNKYLDTLDPAQVLQNLKQLAENKEDITICCYEKTGEFCHRHPAATWLYGNNKEINRLYNF